MGGWVIRCCHYCPLSSPWGDSIVSRGTHGHCFNHLLWGWSTTNQPRDHTNVFQTFSHPFRFAALVLGFPPLIGVFGWRYSWGHIVLLVRFQPGSMIMFGDRTLQLVFPSWRYAPILCLEVDRHSSLGAAWSDLDLDTGARLANPGFTPSSYTAQWHTQAVWQSASQVYGSQLAGNNSSPAFPPPIRPNPILLSLSHSSSQGFQLAKLIIIGGL